MKIPVKDNIILDLFAHEDAEDVKNGVDDPVMHHNTLSFPEPYLLEHASEWIKYTQEQNSKAPHPEQFCIRKNGKVIGGIGMIKTDKKGFNHSVEIGYWLRKEERGKGIIIPVIKKYCDYIFAHFAYIKITATIFTSNTASLKVIEKAGFAHEALLLKHIQKKNEYIDCHIYYIFKEN